MSFTFPNLRRAHRRLPTALWSILASFVVGGLVLLSTGNNPLTAYRALVSGALSLPNLPDTLNWAMPVVGMTLVAAIPLRAGMLNLGGDGQLVVGGLVAAIVPLHLPFTGFAAIVISMAAAIIAAGLYALLAAWGEISRGIPMLISSLLLNYPAVGVASYLVRFPLRDTTSNLPQSAMIPLDDRLPTLVGPLNVGAPVMIAVALAYVWFERRTVGGLELRLSGINARFARYGGIHLARQAYGVMFVSGGIAGLVGSIIVLGSHFRFIDDGLLAPSFGPTGFMAALLAGGQPLGSVAAGLFFAAMQIGGVGMQRDTEVPRVLTMVLQAITILLIALFRRQRTDRE